MDVDETRVLSSNARGATTSECTGQHDNPTTKGITYLGKQTTNYSR